MARPMTVNIVRHLTDGELDEMIKAARRDMGRGAGPKKLYDRLLFVRARYSGHSVEEAAAMVGFSRATGYNTQDLWNEMGPDHLLPMPNPGRPPKMTAEQREALRAALAATPMETGDVMRHIEAEYGIRYSMKQVHVILSKMGLCHAKPHPAGHCRPDNDEEVLKKGSNMVWTARRAR